MERFSDYIDKQIRSNQNKNILIDNLEMFSFSDDTIKALTGVGKLNPESKRLLVDYAIDRAIEEFCRVNQYYSFDTKARTELRTIYEILFESLGNTAVSPADLSKAHYERLQKWLISTNPFSEKIYSKTDHKIVPVACAEYSSELQTALLHLDVSNLLQPLLDLGCGKHGNLVQSLNSLGLDAWGIDRFAFNDPRLLTADWLEFNYEKEKWGTIISNLGFSNHFIHHNLREDGNYLAYAKTYMNILHSLKKGGRFHYAPDLPFIEKYIDISLFEITKYEMSESNFKTTVITRLQ